MKIKTNNKIITYFKMAKRLIMFSFLKISFDLELTKNSKGIKEIFAHVQLK